MKKIIYTKYSNERRKEYRILTSIAECGDNKVVIKKPLSEDAYAHIKNVSNNYDKIKNVYINDNVYVTKNIFYNNEVQFEFIEGKSYSQVICDALSFNDMKGKILIFADIVRNTKNRYKVDLSDEKFTKVFGEFNNTDIELYGDKCSNVDMIFDNIIVDADGRYCITDYEWVFDCVIPYEYIIFRALLLNIEFSKLDEDKKQEVYNSLGFSEQMIGLFNTMELRFQAFVSGKSIFAGYKRKNACININALDLSSYSQKCYVTKIKDGIEIGKYFKEINKTIRLQERLGKDEKIIINPTQSSAIIKINFRSSSNLDIKSNSTFIVNNDYYFATSPEIIISSMMDTELDMDINILHTGDVILKEYIEKTRHLNEISGELEWHKKAYNEYRNSLESVVQEYQNYRKRPIIKIIKERMFKKG